MRKAEREKIEARNWLADKLPPGTIVYTLVSHVSKSGMSRSIRVFIMSSNAYLAGEWEPWEISGKVAGAVGWSFDPKHGGVKVSGCGMDMGFHLVNTLSYEMHGFYGPFPMMRRYPHREELTVARAGYTLHQRWL